jgi:ribonuclease HI
VSGHEGIVGNETADQLARTGSEHPFIGPEPACGISIGVDNKAVRNCTNRNHKIKTMGIRNWTQTGKEFILGPSARRTKDLLKLNRDQLAKGA